MKYRSLPFFTFAFTAALGMAPSLHAKTADGKPLVVFIAGNPSHGPGEHEHNAGVLLLAKCLNQGAPNVATKVHLNAEWPSAEEFAQADTVVIYSDGGGGHPMLQGDHLRYVEKGDGCRDGPRLPALRGGISREEGGPEALDWMGGFFEANWSVNPHWNANFQKLPKHPITRGVKPFTTNDEWYFHMRFREDRKLTPHPAPRPARKHDDARGRTTPRKPNRARRGGGEKPQTRPGRMNVRKADAVSDLPAATFTRAGPMSINASWC